MNPREWYRNWYRFPVAMNLRLPEALAASLRELAETTGRSQQDLAREALEEYVRNYSLRDFDPRIRHLLTAPAVPFEDSTPSHTAETGAVELIRELRGER